MSSLKAGIVHVIHSVEKSLFIGIVTVKKINPYLQSNFSSVELNVSQISFPILKKSESDGSL